MINSNQKIAVACITAQPHCERIINAAKTAAGSCERVVALTIRSNNLDPERKADEDACLKMLSEKTGVTIKEIFDEAPLLSLVNLIEQLSPFSVFTGKPGQGSNFVGQLALLCNTVVSVVSEDGITVATPDSELAKNKD